MSPGLTKGTSDEDLSTGHAIGKGSSGNRGEGRDDGVGEIVTELTGDRGDTEVVVDDGVEVTETVTRELTKDGDHEDLGHPPSPGVSEEERAV